MPSLKLIDPTLSICVGPVNFTVLVNSVIPCSLALPKTTASFKIVPSVTFKLLDLTRCPTSIFF